jgi:hypothetical protein
LEENLGVIDIDLSTAERLEQNMHSPGLRFSASAPRIG